jgi:hypothetical protein
MPTAVRRRERGTRVRGFDPDGVSASVVEVSAASVRASKAPRRPAPTVVTRNAALRALFRVATSVHR